MAFILSPNMNLPIPSVGSEQGPNYAFDVNNSLTLLDQHDHSPGRGVQITPAGLNLNTDVSFLGNSAINLNSVVLLSNPNDTTLQSIFVAPGSETPAINDLWYLDSAGNAVQLTSNGIVNSTAAAIPGESYAAGTFFWKQTQDGLPTTPANFDIGSITIRPTVAATSNGIILSPPSALTSQYSLLLPLLPISQSFMTLDQSGNITAPISTNQGIVAANIAPNTITAAQIAPNTITTTQISPTAGIIGGQIALATVTPANLTGGTAVTSASSGNFTSNSLPYINITNLNVTLTTVNIARPVFFYFNATPQAPSSGSLPSNGSVFASNNGAVIMQFEIIDQNGRVVFYSSINGADGAVSAPMSSFNCADFAPTATTMTYTCIISGFNTGVYSVLNTTMTAIQV